MLKDKRTEEKATQEMTIYLVIRMMQEIIRTSGHSHVLCLSALSYDLLGWISFDTRRTERHLQRKKSRQMKVSGKLQQRDGEDDKVQERKDEGRRGGRQKERKMKSGF